MYFTTSLALISGLAATAVAAGTASVVNKCSSDIYLTITLATQTSSIYDIPSGESYTAEIVGEGNSWGITTNDDYYSASTPKYIWGFSDSPPTLYYSVNTVDGTPNVSFALSSTASSTVLTSADAVTYTGPDTADYTFQLC